MSVGEESVGSLAAALERERVMSDISRQVRTRLDVKAVLDNAVVQAGRALDALRAFVRIDDGGEDGSFEAYWSAPGAPQLLMPAHRLATANLAARELRTIAIADVRVATEYDDLSLGGRESLLGSGTLAALATPILVGNRLVGVLGFHRDEVGVWSESEIELAEGVAREAGLAIHMARLLDETEQRLAQATALFEAARVVTGELRLEAVLKRLVRALARLLRADAADCYLVDNRRNTLRCTAAFNLDPAVVHWEFPAEQGLAGEALRQGRSLFSRDYPRLAAQAPHPAYAGFVSSLVAPMVLGSEKQGVLGVSTSDPKRAFGPADADLLEAFAGLASVALANAATYEQSARQARVQRGFYRIASALAEPLSLRETLEAVAQAARDALGGRYAAALDTREGALTIAGSGDLPRTLAEVLERATSEAAPALHEVAQTGRIVAVPALASDDRFDPEWRELATAAGTRAVLAIPLEDVAELGPRVVVIFFSDERSFTDDDLELAQHLAAAAAGALERSELFEAERSSRTLAQHLARIAGTLAQELNPRSVLREVAREVPALLDADTCAVYEVRGNELALTVADGPGAEGALGFRGAPRGLPAREVFESRAPVARDSASDDERAADPLLASGHSAHVSVPLTGPDGTIQAVISAYARGSRAWRADEVDALLAVAATASAALGNAYLYERVALDAERNDAILAAIADGIVATDEDGLVVLWNAAAERITGVPASEAVGRAPVDLLQRNLASEGDVPVGDRTIAITRGGAEVWLSLTEAIMTDADGRVAGRVFAFRDISSERIVEQMKSDFVSTVSHELRTPLTSIYGFSATLLREDLDFDEAERRTFLAYIASESERLTRILDSLLHVARLDSGDLDLHIAPTNVASVVEAVVAAAQEEAADGRRFVVDVPETPVSACADEARLKQILGVLLDNAVKYSPPGGVVTVAARERTDTVELRVVDEGAGIPPGEQARIFTRFYRGSGQSVNGERGPGLSLFIARGLATAMGGRISVSSSEGKGSSFVVELPAA